MPGSGQEMLRIMHEVDAALRIGRSGDDEDARTGLPELSTIDGIAVDPFNSQDVLERLVRRAYRD
jgi:hypothetical protein